MKKLLIFFVSTIFFLLTACNTSPTPSSNNTQALTPDMMTFLQDVMTKVSAFDDAESHELEAALAKLSLEGLSPQTLGDWDVCFFDILTGKVLLGSCNHATGDPNIQFVSNPSSYSPASGQSFQPNFPTVRIDFDPAIKGPIRAHIFGYYGKTPSGWTLDIADSEQNNGYGGSWGDPDNAELDIKGSNSALQAYSQADNPNPYSATNPGGMATTPSKALNLKQGSLFYSRVSDQSLVWTCWLCAVPSTLNVVNFSPAPENKLFRLGTPNAGTDSSDIWVGFNRVVDRLYGNPSGNRQGSGVTLGLILLERFRKPVDPTPVCTGRSTGDPHLITFDGVAYDFYAAGWFNLVQSLVDPMLIKVYQDYVPTWPSNSVNKQVQVHSASGDVINIVAGTPLVGLPWNLPGLQVTQLASNKYHVLDLQNYTQIEVTDNVSHLNIKVSLTNALAGNVTGLLGNCNGNPRDDIPSTLANMPSRNIEPLEWQQAQHEVAAQWVALGSEFKIPEKPVLLEEFEPHIQDKALGSCKELGIEIEYLLEACAIDNVLLDMLTFDREDVEEIQKQLRATETLR